MRFLVLIAVVLLAVACGPEGPTEEGGDPVRPGELLAGLPSPGDLRGPPAAAVGAAGLQRAFTGRDDPGLTEVIATRAPRAAAARHWTDPDGGRLVAAASVWQSHLVATGIGSDLAARLVAEGGRAWTPSGLPGARGARREGPRGRELRLGLSIGPNALYVRATGDVDEGVVIEAMERMALLVAGQTG